MASRSVPLVVAAALVVSAVFAVTTSGPRTFEPVVDDGYVATYRVTDLAADRPATRREVVEIRRPYSGRTRSEVDGSTATGRITNRTFELQLGESDDIRFGVRRVPGGPVRDVSYAALRDAAGAGAIEVRGRADLDGRPCTWFAFGAPFPESLRPPAREVVEACVDAAGVLVREVWTIGTRVVRTTDLVAFDDRPPPARRFYEGRDPADLDVSQPEAADALATSMVVSDDEDLPDPVIEIDAPGGWRRDRTAGVVQASPLDGRATQSSHTTFVRDGAVVVVERSFRADPPTWSDEGLPVDTGIGDARMMFFPSHVEVRIRTNEHGFARVSAPGREIAEAFARALRLPGS